MIAEMEDRREGFGLDMCEMVTWQQVLDVGDACKGANLQAQIAF